MISLRVLNIHPLLMNFPSQYHHHHHHHHCQIFLVYQTNTHTHTNNKRSDHFSLAAIRTQTYFFYFRTFETQEKIIFIYFCRLSKFVCFSIVSVVHQEASSTNWPCSVFIIYFNRKIKKRSSYN